MSEFQKTVDLSEKKTPKEPVFAVSPQKRVIKKKPVSSRANAIDEMFKDRDDEPVKNVMHQISRPTKSQSDDGFFRKVTLILFVVLIAVLTYFMFFKNTSMPQVKGVAEVGGTGWYSVKLMNGESYYGEIENTGSDPVVIKNVYYNYDQINAEKTGEVVPESSNLRLVKRGKETHGPDGTMSVVRAQVVYMEPLKEDSKVLKAILNYEK